MNRTCPRIGERITTLLLQLLPLVVFLVVWQILSGVIERGVFFFGSPLSVATVFIKKVGDGSLFVDAGVTAIEALAGFVIGNLIGSVIGLGLWYSDKVARIARPYIVVVGSIPIFAVAPIMILWFGIGVFSKIAMATISTLLVATVQAYEGARDVDPEQIRMMSTLGATKSQTFQKIVVPSSLTWVLAGYKLNVSFAILGAFIGEFISAERGLGHMIVISMGLFNIPSVLAGVLCIVIIALLFTFLLGRIEHLLLRWKYQT